jgi:hypothetical protein
MMPGQPKRRRWVLPVVLAAVVVLAAAGGAYWFSTRSTDTPVAATTTTPPQRTATIPGAILDPIGIEVCAAVDASQSGDVAAMKALGAKAATSGDQRIKLAGMILRDQALLAEFDGGKGPEAVRMVGEAANLMTACLNGGYDIKPP